MPYLLDTLRAIEEPISTLNMDIFQVACIVKPIQVWYRECHTSCLRHQVTQYITLSPNRIRFMQKVATANAENLGRDAS